VADEIITSYAPLYITADARELLQERGFRNVDEMSMKQRRSFQHAYLDRKIERESHRQNYITDRSFVDVAAYWLEYTSGDDLKNDEFVCRCRDESRRYDLHLYFPSGLIRFEHDGARSLDPEVHRRIDERILTLLSAWSIRPLVIAAIDIDQRLALVRKHLDGNDG
jgi:hypothetical protein